MELSFMTKLNLNKPNETCLSNNHKQNHPKSQGNHLSQTLPYETDLVVFKANLHYKPQILNLTFSKH